LTESAKFKDKTFKNSGINLDLQPFFKYNKPIQIDMGCEEEE
jgi:hypothetical protein